jgi:MFS transporter, ACS family, pantothenate transporter
MPPFPLRAWRTSDSPKYPVGFPLAAAFAGVSILAMLALRSYVRKHPGLLDFGFGWQSQTSDVERSESETFEQAKAT